MKNTLLALLTTVLLTTALEAPSQVTPQTDPTPTLEAQLQDLEFRMDAYDSGLEESAKAVADLGSDQQMKKFACIGFRAALPNTLRELRVQTTALAKQRSQMSEAQLARFSVCESRLLKASPDIPACAGK